MKGGPPAPQKPPTCLDSTDPEAHRPCRTETKVDLCPLVRRRRAACRLFTGPWPFDICPLPFCRAQTMPDPTRLLHTLRQSIRKFRETPGRRGQVVHLADARDVFATGDLHGNLENFRRLLA